MTTRLATRRLLSLLLGVAFSFGCLQSSSSRLEIGQTIPEFELRSLTGEVVSSEALRGTPTVLNFWATWCRPCRHEIPALKAIFEDPRSNGSKVISIALDDEGESIVGPFAERNAVEYPVLLGNRDLFSRFGGVAIPYTVVIDSKLTVVSVYRGVVSLKTLERDLRRAT